MQVLGLTRLRIGLGKFPKQIIELARNETRLISARQTAHLLPIVPLGLKKRQLRSREVLNSQIIIRPRLRQ